MAQKELIRDYEVDFVKIEASQEFKRFLKRKRKFLIPMTAFFMIFYFLLPIFTSYTTFLNTPAIGDISWTWIFAFCPIYYGLDIKRHLCQKGKFI